MVGTLQDELLANIGPDTTAQQRSNLQNPDFHGNRWYGNWGQVKTLEKYLHYYNHERPHQERMMEGRTPAQMFETGITEQPEETIPQAA